MRQLFLLLIIGCLRSTTGWAQVNLAGRVTDEKGQPLAGVNLVIRGTALGATTQGNGEFTLHVDTELPLTLVASSIGYQRRQVLVRGNNFRNIQVTLPEEAPLSSDMLTAASRIPEDVQNLTVTAEKLSASQVQPLPTISPFDALHYLKGVNVFTQSLLNKSINLRGFGSTTNSRLVQLNDGMDNRSPGLGFGFGNVAGIPDLDIARLELVPGASSALYGPDAEQGLLVISSKDPFTYQGLSAQFTAGVNNVGKAGFGPKPYGDIAVRYAKQLGDRFAVKVNFQRTSGTDFIADDYSDRSTRTRSNFLATNPNQGGLATGIAYTPNNNPNTNFQYDGVNRYGDEVSGTGSSFTFPANYANVLLQNKQVTRTGYTELDLLGNNGRVFNNRATASLHYKLSEHIEASVGWYYGNGNFINTSDFRAYYPNYQRHQFKAELRGDNFFLRAYTTQQKAEAWNIGQTAAAINNSWKSLGQWAAEFGQAYVENKVTVGESRATADRGRLLPGSAQFNGVRDLFTSTYNTDSVPGYRGTKGTRFRDNSALWQYEGMYSFSNLLPIADILVGGNIRHYALNSGGTLFALKPDGSEYEINEFGAYVQVSKTIPVGTLLTIKPIATLRYDKNEYLKGVYSPRASAVLRIGQQHIRASWQSAFHNPTPGQLFAKPTTGKPGEVGGLQAVNVLANAAYQEQDVTDYQAGRITKDQLSGRAYTPVPLTVEQVKTWEIGYKTIIRNKLSIDAFYFHSRYTNAITAQNYYQPANGQLADLDSGAYRLLLINRNSNNLTFVNGWGIGLDYTLGRGFILSGNYTHQVGTITLFDAQGNVINDNAGVPIIQRRMSSPEVIQKGRNYFNSPENQYNISLFNPHLTERLGLTLALRWTGKMWYEQGITAGDVWLPAWSSLDAQVSYKVPQYKATLKLGGTNLLNQYYAQGYGLARVGGMYFVSITFDELLN